MFLFETLLILAAVCALAWVVVRFGVKRLYGVQGGGGAAGARGGRNAPLRIVARLPLEPRRSVYIIEAAGKTLLVGTSEGGAMTTLAELDPRAVAAAEAAAPRQKSFLELLRRPGAVGPVGTGTGTETGTETGTGTGTGTETGAGTGAGTGAKTGTG